MFVSFQTGSAMLLAQFAFNSAKNSIFGTAVMLGTKLSFSKWSKRFQKLKH
jgi:hypothetical protein